MKFKKLHNFMASIFAASLFASPSTSAGLWPNIKSFFGSFSSSSSNTDTDENSTSNEDNTVTDPQENEKLNILIEQLTKENYVPIFTTVNGRNEDSLETLRLSYDHYNSIISNKELSSKLKIKMANESNFKHGNDVFLILSKAEYKDISDHIKNWEAKKKYYRDRHENIMKN